MYCHCSQYPTLGVGRKFPTEEEKGAWDLVAAVAQMPSDPTDQSDPTPDQSNQSDPSDPTDQSDLPNTPIGRMGKIGRIGNPAGPARRPVFRFNRTQADLARGPVFGDTTAPIPRWEIPRTDGSTKINPRHRCRPIWPHSQMVLGVLGLSSACGRMRLARPTRIAPWR